MIHRLAARLACALLPLLASCAGLARGAGEPLEIDVLVYNIHAGKDTALVRNLEQVAAVVRESGADVVLLQEVDRNTERSGREDQIGTLQRLTGFHGAYGRTLDFQGGQYGVGVLSRWPIEADTMHALRVAHPSTGASPSYEDRGVLHVAVRAPWGRLHLLDTHLDASRDDQYRLQQTAAVGERARSLAARGEPVILGGDFNSVPESPAVARVATGGWRDAWTECGVGPAATFPVEVPTRRIDYLFLPATLRCTSARVLESRASDHRAVLFTVVAR